MESMRKYQLSLTKDLLCFLAPTSHYYFHRKEIQKNWQDAWVGYFFFYSPLSFNDAFVQSIERVPISVGTLSPPRTQRKAGWICELILPDFFCLLDNILHLSEIFDSVHFSPPCKPLTGQWDLSITRWSLLIVASAPLGPAHRAFLITALSLRCLHHLRFSQSPRILVLPLWIFHSSNTKPLPIAIPQLEMPQPPSGRFGMMSWHTLTVPLHIPCLLCPFPSKNQTKDLWTLINACFESWEIIKYPKKRKLPASQPRTSQVDIGLPTGTCCPHSLFVRRTKSSLWTHLTGYGPPHHVPLCTTSRYSPASRGTFSPAL